MCDEFTNEDAERHVAGRGLSRRTFNGIAVASAAVAMTPFVRAADAPALVEHDVRITTADGIADAHFVHPEAGTHAAVLVWPDILGLRPAFRSMGRHLAEQGYAVLTVNPYYRRGEAPVVPEGASFRDPEIRERVMPLARSLSAATTRTDAAAFVTWLDAQDVVDRGRGIGTTGYCMGGPMVFRTAAHMAERIRGAASFHGGGLVTDEATSPHRLIPRTEASFLVAIAENDHERDPQARSTLRRSFAEAEVPAEVEVYEGAMHGWVPPDSAVHDPEAAEKAWTRLFALFDDALA